MKIFKYLSHSFSLMKKLKEVAQFSALPVSRIPQAWASSSGSRHTGTCPGSHHWAQVQAEARTAAGCLPEQSLGAGARWRAPLPTQACPPAPHLPGLRLFPLGKTRVQASY